MESKTLNREQLIQQLESVYAGLSPKAIIEQSECFVFVKKRIHTFNDEVACQIKYDIGIKGAVKAAPLLKLLYKLKEETLEVSTDDEGLKIKGKRKTSHVFMESAIELPIDNVDQPEEWNRLHEDFNEAIKIVSLCAGKDETKFWTTCIHIHPKWVEACDSYQLSRYKLKTKIKEPFLVRSSSIKHVFALDMTEFSETASWLHFRNSTGLILSIRRFVGEEYKDLSPMLKVEGTPTTLPKFLAESAGRAEIFSVENADDNLIQVELRPGKVRIRGEGASGNHTELRKIAYDGEPISFTIAPQLLADLTQRHNDCEITEGMLKVDGGKFVYCTCLSKLEEQDDEIPEDSDSEED